MSNRYSAAIQKAKHRNTGFRLFFWRNMNASLKLKIHVLMWNSQKSKNNDVSFEAPRPRLLPSAYNADVPLASSWVVTKSSGGFRPSLRCWYVWWMTSCFMFVRWASPSLAYLQASMRQHPTVHVSKGPSRNLQTWWFFVTIARITTIIPEMAGFFSFCEKLKCCLLNSDILL